MKKFLFFCALLCISTWGFAQTTDVPMATLQHGDKVSVYYNNNAFIQAYEAAADSGDVITLSAGIFSTPANIQKSLSIIGNGFVTNEEKGIYPTVLTGGETTISPRDITNEDGETIKEAVSINGMRLEGLDINIEKVYFRGERTAKDVQFIKCKLSSRTTYLYSNTINFTFRQCAITGFLDGGACLQQNLFIVNSYVHYLAWGAYARTDNTIFIDHSIIGYPYYCLATYTNCILGEAPIAGCNVNNSIFINCTGDSYTGTGSWYTQAYAGIFEEEMTSLEWDGTKTYKLKYPETYVGTDGTQVGLYGGHYPFNPTPTTPQITECQIDDATATDGKLKVNITVEAQTED